MSTLKLPTMDSEFWEIAQSESCHELGKYLRKKSGDNDWTWKTISNCNLFFSSKGKLIAMVFYSGRAMIDTKTFILKER